MRRGGFRGHAIKIRLQLLFMDGISSTQAREIRAQQRVCRLLHVSDINCVYLQKAYCQRWLTDESIQH